jgi:hypothetical protein
LHERFIKHPLCGKFCVNGNGQSQFQCQFFLWGYSGLDVALSKVCTTRAITGIRDNIMFSRKNTPDSRDAEQVYYTASILNVSEFRLFELAYQEWFGESGAEACLEAAYMAYVVCGSTPVWVRNYVRKTLALCDEAGMYVPQMVSLPCAASVFNRENAIIVSGLFLILLLTI